MPPDTWRPSSPSSMAPHQFNNFGPDNSMSLMGGPVTAAADNVWYKPSLCQCYLFIAYLPLIIVGCFSASDVSWEWFFVKSDSCADIISYGTAFLELLMFVN